MTIDHPLAPASRSRSLDVLCHVDGSLSSTDMELSAPNGTDSLPTTEIIADVTKSPSVTTLSTGVPVRHGAHLTLSDHERLRVFIHEFVMHGLIPWAEKTIRTLNEQVSMSSSSSSSSAAAAAAALLAFSTATVASVPGFIWFTVAQLDAILSTHCGNSWNFYWRISRTWKLLDNDLGPE